MDQEFCPHLEIYARNFGNTRDAYLDCLELMDHILSEGVEEDTVFKVQKALDSWERHTRDLRGQFVGLVKTGEVLLPREGQNPTPVCAHCGAVVPRLEFPEFRWEEDGSILYRGQQLEVPESVAS